MSVKNSITTSDYLNFDSTLNKAMKIIKTEKNYKLGFLIVFGINAGLRISDILKLKFEDLENDSISLVESKTNKKRVIRLNDNIKNAYELLKIRTHVRTGYIFTSNQSTIITVQYINRKLKEIFGTKNIAVSSHSLRKTFGRQVWSNNNETDKALLYLSELFNHSSPAITKRYLGIRQEELDDIYMNL
ncbi:tyrosine-type recombinase/integrase [Flavobacterium ginsenosidimutans]|uniref:tyrosine-type recombinase/integrase n=1 Tax=Flavobacterium ginsenosidimutans TaxID=687844 RepID=UPI000DAE9176|nr:tyrosine-type recombinase/integrase [Flavobacterium ginsenosidimutans]KAF2338036.1 tyrosine-type recombinase/integrase [Flavobacterium ginsenosidimutans]